MKPKMSLVKVGIEGEVLLPGGKDAWTAKVDTYELTCLDPECGYEEGFLDPGEAVEAHFKHLNEKHSQV